MNSGIYIVTVADKVYIGSTGDLKRRKREHKSRFQTGTHHIDSLQREYDKFNYFNFNVLEYCGKENLIEREQHYLDVMKPNANISMTAGNNRGTKRTPEQIEKMAKHKRGNEKNNERLLSFNVVRRLVVSQYGIDGKYITTYESSCHAAREVNGNDGNILACCKGRQKTAYGYQWKFGNDSKDIQKGIRRSPKSAVCQFSKDGQFIAEYESTCEAARRTGTCQSHISGCCQGLRKTSNGFIWKYAKEL